MSAQQKKRPAGDNKQQPQQKKQKGGAPQPKGEQKQQKKPQQQQQKGEQKQQKKPQQQQQKQPAKEKKQPVKEQETEDVTDPALEGLDEETVNQLTDLDEQLENIAEKIGKEVRKIELTFEKDRKPLLTKRDELVKNIPEFWMKVFIGNPELREMLTPADLELASHFASLNVTTLPPHADGTDAGFKITISFKPNPIVESKTVTKEYKLTKGETEEDEDIEINSTELKFKDKKFVDANGDAFLLNWFTMPDKESDYQLGMTFRDDIYPKAFQYFINSTDGSDDEDGDDDIAASLAAMQDEDGEGEEGGDD